MYRTNNLFNRQSNSRKTLVNSTVNKNDKLYFLSLKCKVLNVLFINYVEIGSYLIHIRLHYSNICLKLYTLL